MSEWASHSPPAKQSVSKCLAETFGGDISVISVPNKVFVPPPQPPAFEIAKAINKDEAGGTISKVNPLGEPFIPPPSPPVIRIPSEYVDTGMKMTSIRVLAATGKGEEDDNEADFGIGEPFERSNGVYVRVSAKKIVRISNFTVRIVAKVIQHGLKGDEVYYLLELVGERLRSEIQIRATAYLNLAAKLRSNKPAYRLYPDSGKQEAYFRVYLSVLVEDAYGKIAERVLYTYHGWQQLVPHRWRYMSGLDAYCTSPFCLLDLANISSQELHEADMFAWRALELGDLFVILPIFLHSHTGYLKRLFEEAGIPVRFILVVCGPTGIGKTLLMELLFCAFMPIKKMANFTSTASGLERWFRQFHDRNAVIDDLSTVTNRATRALAETCLRQYCDDNSRIVAERGNDGYRSEDLCFGLSMTTEAQMEGESQSSQIRKVEIPMTADTLNDAVVKEFKKRILQDIHHIIANPNTGETSSILSPLDVYTTRFIRFIESNFESIVDFIRAYEPPPISNKFRRHEAAYRVLATEGQIILRYFVTAGVLGAEQAQTIFLHQWIPMLNGLMNYNSSIGHQSDPARVFLDTLAQNIGLKSILIAESRSCFANNPNGALGFWLQEKDGTKLVLDSDRSYQMVKQHFEKMRIPFTVAPQQLLQMIANHGLSEVYQRKDRKTPKPLKEFTINGMQMKLLVLKWDVVQRFIHENKEVN